METWVEMLTSKIPWCSFPPSQQGSVVTFSSSIFPPFFSHPLSISVYVRMCACDCRGPERPRSALAVSRKIVCLLCLPTRLWHRLGQPASDDYHQCHCKRSLSLCPTHTLTHTHTFQKSIKTLSNQKFYRGIMSWQKSWLIIDHKLW